MRLCDLEVIENSERVGVEVLVGVDIGRRRHIGWRIAAGGIGDAAMAAREVTHLRLPISVIRGEFVEENNWASLAGFFEVKPHVVLRARVGHFVILSSTRRRWQLTPVAAMRLKLVN